MSLNSDYQKLEPGDSIRLFEIDGRAFNMGEVLYFHGYNVPHSAEEIVAAGGMNRSCQRKVSGGRALNIKPGRASWKGLNPPPRGAMRNRRCEWAISTGQLQHYACITTTWRRRGSRYMRPKSSISMRKTSRRETRQQTLRRKSVSCILSMPKILKLMKRWSSPSQARWTCRG